MLLSFAILLVFQCLGEGIAFVFGLPVPGPVIGMLMLFGALIGWPGLARMVEAGAHQLLGNLSLLFVPAGAGIVVAGASGSGHWLAIVVTLLASTLLTLAITAQVLRLFPRQENDLA
jgi:putative effector of murein hydrolase LrgA (UPF0299 family)